MRASSFKRKKINFIFRDISHSGLFHSAPVHSIVGAESPTASGEQAKASGYHGDRHPVGETPQGGHHAVRAGLAFFTVTAAMLGGFTIFTVPTTPLGELASVMLTATFLGILTGLALLGLFVGQRIHIILRERRRRRPANVTVR